MKTGVPGEDSTLKNQLWWTLALVAATAVLLGRRGFVHYVEQGKSASQVFSLRARCLPYITLWAILAILATVLAFFQDISECISVAGLVFGEFVAVCLWQHYFENNDFVSQCIEETEKRLWHLLTHGMGMNDTEVEKFCCAVEGDLVEFWRTHLGHRKWSRVSREELGEVLFHSGAQIGKTMTRTLWEGALFDVEAFMREWMKDVEYVRIPKKIAEAMESGGDSNDQALACVAIILANETKEVRDARKNANTEHADGRFCASRIATRKAAAEGILHWPSCLARVSDIRIRGGIKFNTEKLFILDKGTRRPCSQDKIPFSVECSLIAIIEAGYLHILPEGKINTEVTFKCSNMVFKKNDWNTQRTIERKPFRFITSATYMAGDPAFMVEQRETSGEKAELDGSGYLEGALNLEVDVDVKEGSNWLQTSEASDAATWGDTKEFLRPERVCFLNWPVLWAIKGLWFVFHLFATLHKCLTSIQQRFGLTSDQSPLRQSRSPVRERAEHALFDQERRNMQNRRHGEEVAEISRRYHSPPDHNNAVSENDAEENLPV